jgi:hypothetical protein
MRSLLALVMVLAGCGPVLPAPIVIREPRPDPLPLTIGVRYPDELRMVRRVPMTFVDQARGQTSRNTSKILVGQASVKLFDEVLGLLFDQVVSVPVAASDGGAPRDVAAVIEPTIQDVAIQVEHQPDDVFTDRGSITYRLTLFSPVGEQLATWTVTGTGVEQIKIGAFGPKRSGTGDQSQLELAMRDAAWTLMTGFRDVPEVRRWLDRRNVK